MTKRAKLLILFAGIVGFVGLIQLGFYLYSHNQVKNIQREKAYASEIYSQIDRLFVEPSEGFLIEDITWQDIEFVHGNIVELQKSVKPLPNLVSTYNDLNRRYSALSEINKIHDSPAIIGNKVVLETPFVKDLKSVTVNRLIDEYYIEEGNDDFQVSVNLILDGAKDQTVKYEKALFELEQLEHLPIEEGYYTIIARGMKDVEDIYSQIKNETFLSVLNEEITTYAVEFMNVVFSEVKDISKHSELKAAMEISPYIQRLLDKD